MRVSKARVIKLSIVVVLSLFVALFIVTAKAKPSKKLIFLSMNTEVEILIYDRFSPNIETANIEIVELFRTLDSLWNPYDSNSEISAINRNAGFGKPLKVNPMTYDLVKTAVDFNLNVSPKFNIAVGPLIDLWKKAAKNDKMPCGCTVTRYRKQLLDNRRIELDSANQTIYLKNLNMKINFGAIAKGYAQKEVIKIMKRNRIDFYIVNSGGDMYVSSKYFRDFGIGVKNPYKKEKIADVIKVSNSGVATSGDYERYYMIAGKKYSHIINPVTGYPEEQFNSSTVIHENPLMADIWATTLSIKNDSLLLEKISSQSGMYLLINPDTTLTNYK